VALILGVAGHWLRHGLADRAETAVSAQRRTALATPTGRTGPRPRDPEADHILKAGTLADAFAVVQGRPLRTVTEVRAWAMKAGKAGRGDFRSTRDGRLYELLTRDAALVEHTGKNGRRFVYHRAIGVVELTEDVLKILADSGVVDKRKLRGASPEREPSGRPPCPPAMEPGETAGAPH
jgi:hypothetical protein